MGSFPTSLRSSGTTTSYTTITPPPETIFWNMLESYITATPDPMPAFNDDSFVAIMRTRFGITTYLSIQSSIMNGLLLSFLLYNREFRSWLFFPLMLQAAIDIIGPGISNLFFEWKLYLHVFSTAESYSGVRDRNQRLVVGHVDDLNALTDGTGCILMYVRCLLNEYTTGKEYCRSRTNQHKKPFFLKTMSELWILLQVKAEKQKNILSLQLIQVKSSQNFYGIFMQFFAKLSGCSGIKRPCLDVIVQKHGFVALKNIPS